MTLGKDRYTSFFNKNYYRSFSDDFWHHIAHAVGHVLGWLRLGDEVGN